MKKQLMKKQKTKTTGALLAFLLTSLLTLPLLGNPLDSFKDQAEAVETWQDAGALEQTGWNLIETNPELLEDIFYIQYGVYSKLTRAQKIPSEWIIWDYISKGFEETDLANGVSTYPTRSWTNYVHTVLPYNAFVEQIRAAETILDQDQILQSYLAENTVPLPYKEILNDSRTSLVAQWNVSINLARTLGKLNNPHALPYALLSWRLASTERELEDSIKEVAVLLKNKDFNTTRSNAWLAQQEGGEAVVFTQNELKSPLSNITPSHLTNSPRVKINWALGKGEIDLALVLAKEEYRNSNTSSSINAAIGRIAQVLRVKDGNNIRANAFIQSQKEGTEFEFTD